MVIARVWEVFRITQNGKQKKVTVRWGDFTHSSVKVNPQVNASTRACDQLRMQIDGDFQPLL